MMLPLSLWLLGKRRVYGLRTVVMQGPKKTLTH